MEYNDIYGSFLSRVKDPSLLAMSNKDRKSILGDYLRRGLARPEVRRLFSSVSQDDDFEEISYVLRTQINSGESASEDAFVEDVIVQAMVIEWMYPQVDNSVSLTPYIVGGKEEKALKNSLSVNIAQLKRREVQLKRFIRDHGFFNAAVEG